MSNIAYLQSLLNQAREVAEDIVYNGNGDAMRNRELIDIIACCKTKSKRLEKYTRHE